MTYMIICTVMIIVTVLILKDTHVKVYWTGYSSNYANIDDEYDFGVPIWAVLLIIILGFVPVLNVVLYIAGYTYYIIHAMWNPNKMTGYTHKFTLRGENLLTKIIKRIWKILNLCI